VKKKEPQVDEAARAILYRKIEERFISPDERLARVEAAFKVQGYRTMSRFAAENGIYPASMQKALQSPRPSIISLYKIAAALGVSMAYLTERNYFREDKRA